jgi:hypothetical protein
MTTQPRPLVLSHDRPLFLGLHGGSLSRDNEARWGCRAARLAVAVSQELRMLKGYLGPALVYVAGMGLLMLGLWYWNGGK